MADPEPTLDAAQPSIAVTYQALLETLPTAAYVCDVEGRIVYHNRRAEELWGRAPNPNGTERYCGAHALAFADGTPIPSGACWAAAALREGRPCDGEEVIVIRPDGDRRAVLAHASLLHGAGGVITGSVNVLIDVTEQRNARAALERSEQSLGAFFDSVAIGAVQVAADGRFMRVNDRFCEITGYAREELLEMGPFDLAHPDEREEDYRRVREYVAGSCRVYHTEKRYLRKNGDAVWVQVAANLIRDRSGQPLYSLAVIEDITERKLAEQALQQADRLKDEFLAVLAHELRNPLAPMRNAVELLRDPQAQAGNWCREIIERQVNHLTRLIDDLLDVSRITRDKLEVRRERTTLSEVLGAAIEASRPVLDRCEQELRLEEPEEPLPIDGDLVRLTQVFTNLLKNAAKFTAGPGTITVTVARQAERVRVVVADTGVGMTSDELPRVFDMFFQGSSRGRSFDGLGIGLSLVRRIVELHGGVVEARSAGRGLGSELIVWLPIAPPLSAEASAGSAPREVAAGKRVLIVDDNRDGADSLGRLLELMGHEAVTEYDGFAALERAKAFPPDVVLLDLGMPGLDGYEVCRRLRAQCGRVQPSIVAITGWGREQDRARTEQAGFDAHLVKPVERSALQRLLETSAG